MWIHTWTRLSSITLLTGVGVTSACGGGDAARSVPYEFDDSAGVVIVRNHSALWAEGDEWIVESTPTVSLGADDSEAGPFFRVTRVRVRGDGGLVVLDGGDSELRFFDPLGRPTGVSAGEGDGPGELRGPRELYLLPGDTLLVWDRMGRNYFTLRGDFLDRQTVAGNRIQEHLLPDRAAEGYRGLPDGSVLVVGYDMTLGQDARSVQGRTRTSMLFARAPLDGSRLDTMGLGLDREWFSPSSGVGRGRTLLGPQMHWAAGGDPLRVVIGDNAVEEVRIYGLDGALEHVVRFPDVDRSVPPGAVEAARTDRRGVQAPAAALERFLAEAPDPERVPAFGGLLIDAEGKLWVLPYLPDEGASAWQRPPMALVFDGQGRYLGSVELPDRLRVHEVGSRYIAGVVVDEVGVEYVQLHPLHR